MLDIIECMLNCVRIASEPMLVTSGRFWPGSVKLWHGYWDRVTPRVWSDYHIDGLVQERRNSSGVHDDVIKWKHFPRNWPFVREIHRSPVNFPHKGQWRGALMFSLIYAWINDWVNNHEAGDLRRQHGHYDVIVMYVFLSLTHRHVSV